MCGRYTLHQTMRELSKRFHLARFAFGFQENYNVAPGQFMPVIIEEDGERKVELMKWGLVPTWAKDPSMGYKLINARDDTVFERPTWRHLILHRRALIPADGFYEWKRIDENGKERKQPYFIHPKDENLFAFAGLWDSWKDVEGKELRTFSIITTEANEEMSAIHNRMPVILHPEDEASWLESSRVKREEIEPFLHPYEDNGLEIFAVSRDVNVVRNNDKKLIYPIDSQ